MEETLRSLRLDKRLSHDDVVAWVAEYLKEPPKTRRASILWEFRGVNDADIRQALSELYGKSLDEIRIASNNSRDTGGPSLARGRPKISHNEIKTLDTIIS